MTIVSVLLVSLLTAPADMRIELYREVDRGDPSAGANKHVGPDGKVYGMGRADHRPAVERCELTLDAKTRASLMQQKLTYLPYFRDQKPDTTLAAYFEAQGNEQAMRNLLPASLEGYLKHPAERRASLDTIVEPDSTGVMSVVVVWLDARHWYVDRVFYRFGDFDPAALPRGACEDVLQGTLREFLRDSPLVTLRRSEGNQTLRHPKSPTVFPPSTPVIELSLSPGMPNTSHYELFVFPDGSYRFGRGAAMTGFDPHRLTQLLVSARRVGLARVADGPGSAPRFGHDQQVTSLRLRLGDTLLSEQLHAETPKAVVDFVGEVQRAYGIKN